MSFEGPQVYFSNQGLVNPEFVNQGDNKDLTREEALKRMVNFLREFQHNNVYVYR